MKRNKAGRLYEDFILRANGKSEFFRIENKTRPSCIKTRPNDSGFVGQFLSVSSLLNATTWYSGVFLLSFDTLSGGRHWSIWKKLDLSFIWGHHHLYLVDDPLTRLLHYLLHRADETQQGRNSCPRLQFLALSLNSIMSLFRQAFYAIISLASLLRFYSLSLADQIFHRSYVNRQHFRLRSFSSLFSAIATSPGGRGSRGSPKWKGRARLSPLSRLYISEFGLA